MCVEPPEKGGTFANPPSHTTSEASSGTDEGQGSEEPMRTTRATGDPAPLGKPGPADSPRKFGQFPDLQVPHDFDDPIPETEIEAWEH